MDTINISSLDVTDEEFNSQVEAMRIRREEAKAAKEAERKAAAEKAAAEVPVLLPPAEVASVVGDAILNGSNARVDFEGEDGTKRRAVVTDLGPRVSKEQTAEMREALNLGGVRAFDVLISDGFNGLKVFWKPGKSPCMDDRGFLKLFRALQSMESNTGCMTQSSYAALAPVLKLMRRRAKC